MYPARKKKNGQSTVEFALLIPILIALLVTVFSIFKNNHRASHKSIKNHNERLIKFANGNGVVSLSGLDIPVQEYIKLLPPDALSAGNLLNQLLLQGLGSTLMDMGINAALSKIPYLNSSTYLSGALEGGLSAAGSSYIGSGFKKVDWEAVGWGAMGGAFSSDQANKDFQGKNPYSGSTRELFGSGLQTGVVRYAQSEGDEKAAVSGSLGGLVQSDTYRNFFGDSILKGALKGALQSSAMGLLSTGKVDLKTVGIGAGFGAFNTKAVAQRIPFADWAGDPRQAASFRGLNAALATYAAGGNSTDALYAGVSGAFFSSQSMDAIAGKSAFKAGLAGAGFGAGVAWSKGQDGQAVGIGALQSMVVSWSTQQARNAAAKAFQSTISKANSVKEINEFLDTQLEEQIIDIYGLDFPSGETMIYYVIPGVAT